MIERRKAPRYEINQTIKVSFGKERYIQTLGINISEIGLLCKTHESVDPLTKLYLMLKVQVNGENKEIQCEGIVIRVEKLKNEYYLGIAFTSMADNYRENLKSFLKSIGKKN